MIEDLTIENLKKHSFIDSEIAELMAMKENASRTTGNVETTFHISNGKIYSGKDAIRKIRFSSETILSTRSFPYEDLDLVPEYYQLKLTAYLEKQKVESRIIFVEKAEIEQFKQDEKDSVNSNIIAFETKPKGFQRIEKETFHKMKFYLKWLNNLDSQPPAPTDQPKTKAKAVTKDEPETRTLKELFKYPEIYEDCLQFLRDKEIINIENELMSGIDKGALLVWIKALEANGLLKNRLIYKEQRSLLNKTFINLDIAESTVKKKDGSRKAKDLYEDDFNEYFKAIRLAKQ